MTQAPLPNHPPAPEAAATAEEYRSRVLEEIRRRERADLEEQGRRVSPWRRFLRALAVG